MNLSFLTKSTSEIAMFKLKSNEVYLKINSKDQYIRV